MEKFNGGDRVRKNLKEARVAADDREKGCNTSKYSDGEGARCY